MSRGTVLKEPWWKRVWKASPPVTENPEDDIDLLIENVVLEAKVKKLSGKLASVDAYARYFKECGGKALTFDEWYEKRVQSK